MSITTLKDISNLQKILQDFDWPFQHVGIRIVDSDYDDYDAEVGSILGPSRCWVDNEWTADFLSGTSCIGLESAVQPVTYAGYSGRRVLVIGGDYAEGGEDAGELVIRDAEVLDVIDL